MKEALFVLEVYLDFQCLCVQTLRHFPIVSITGVPSFPAKTMASPAELTSYSTSIEDSRITSEQVQIDQAQNPQGMAYQ